MKKILVAVAAVSILTMASIADAVLLTIGTADYNGGSYNLIYDKDQSLVWLDYTNALAKWSNQVAWSNSLGSTLTNIHLNPGYSNLTWNSDWRLPSIVDDSPNYLASLPSNYWYSGQYSYGYNNSSSEFAHLFSIELGNKGQYDTSGNPRSDYGLRNKGPFNNLQADWYWSSTEYSSIQDRAWYFSSYYIGQGKDPTYSSMHFGIAVRPGYVTEEIFIPPDTNPGHTSPVPEPSTILMLCIGMAGVAGLRLRRNKLASGLPQAVTTENI